MSPSAPHTRSQGLEVTQAPYERGRRATKQGQRGPCQQDGPSTEPSQRLQGPTDRWGAHQARSKHLTGSQVTTGAPDSSTTQLASYCSKTRGRSEACRRSERPSGPGESAPPCNLGSGDTAGRGSVPCAPIGLTRRVGRAPASKVPAGPSSASTRPGTRARQPVACPGAPLGLSDRCLPASLGAPDSPARGRHPPDGVPGSRGRPPVRRAARGAST